MISVVMRWISATFLLVPCPVRQACDKGRYHTLKQNGKEMVFMELDVIWEIILRDFWGDILRGPQLESRIILLGRLRLDMSSRHAGSDVFKFISRALYALCVAARKHKRSAHPIFWDHIAE
jgi:hypothetical protein